jgi:hypothetical protein
MDIQRLRNLTTGRLHTKMEHIYEDIEYITGGKGIMTHQLPNACDAVQWWLKKHAPDPRFWDGEYDTTHTGDISIDPMNSEDQQTFWKNYGSFPSPFSR